MVATMAQPAPGGIRYLPMARVEDLDQDPADIAGLRAFALETIRRLARGEHVRQDELLVLPADLRARVLVESAVYQRRVEAQQAEAQDAREDSGNQQSDLLRQIASYKEGMAAAVAILAAAQASTDLRTRMAAGSRQVRNWFTRASKSATKMAARTFEQTGHLVFHTPLSQSANEFAMRVMHDYFTSLNAWNANRPKSPVLRRASIATTSPGRLMHRGVTVTPPPAFDPGRRYSSLATPTVSASTMKQFVPMRPQRSGISIGGLN